MSDPSADVHAGSRHPRPLVLVVRLWLRNGDVAAYEAFERRAAAGIARHGGAVERVLRRRADETGDGPFEVQLVTFPDEGALQAYLTDPQTVARAAERAEIIERTEVWRGEEAAREGVVHPS